MIHKILIVDDNQAVLDALSLLLEIHEFSVVTATNPFDALQIVRYQRIELVIQDMNFTSDTTSGEEGKALFYELREINPHLPIILITAWTELATAIELVKAGAADYLPKPWDDAKLLVCIGNLIELGSAKKIVATHNRHQQEREGTFKSADLAGLIFKSTAMERLVTMALQVAKSDISALITGPNGSGKECIAHIIQKNSPLVSQPFIKVNAGALPQELIEAELFGAEAGAYTGITKQRIGRFREDLYYRLNVIELNVPALCERQDDVLALISHFLPHRELTINTEQALQHYKWPGLDSNWKCTT